MNKLRWWGAGAALVAVAAGGAALWIGGGLPSALRGDAAGAGTAKAAAAPAPARPGTGARGENGSDNPAAQPPLEFTAREVVQPTMQRLAAVVEVSGPLVAPQTAVVRAKAGGTLLALEVAEGDRVRAGQVIGRVDMAEANARAAERAAQLASARSTLAQAERSHASNERLAAQQFISPTALDASRTALETAQAAVAAAQAGLNAAGVALREAALVAPIAGIVSRRQVLPGEKVSPEQPVLTLVDLSRLELAAQVGTHEVSRLVPGMPVQVSVEGVAEPLAGRLVRIAPAAEAGTRAIGVTVALANPGERLRAGQYALGRVTLADDVDRLVLPAAAVMAAGGEPYVWVIESGALARRSVGLGRRDAAAGLVEIRSGVAAGAQVLAVRFDNLREGRLARVGADKTSAVAEAAAPQAARPGI
jgi:RND family efflux transporter MFP subunit